jgi:hypothetical protein
LPPGKVGREVISVSGRDRRLEEERRLRRAAVAAAQHRLPEQTTSPETAGPDATGPDATRPDATVPDATEREAAESATAGPAEDGRAAAQRMQQKALWVDLQVQQAMARGDFDDLPGAGKPIRGLGATHDPDWWVKGLIEREKITGVLPPALALRKEDAELDTVLDREATPDAVRRVVRDFNRRVVEARRQLQGGPPVVTPTRDEDQEVAAWEVRRLERRERQRAQLAADAARPQSVRRRGWRRNR